MPKRSRPRSRFGLKLGQGTLSPLARKGHPSFVQAPVPPTLDPGSRVVLQNVVASLQQSPTPVPPGRMRRGRARSRALVSSFQELSHLGRRALEANLL